MPSQGEYITDAKVLRDARRANRLHTSAQNNMRIALETVVVMAAVDPWSGIWALAKIPAEYAAEQAIKDAKSFQKIVGEIPVYARHDDVKAVLRQIDEFRGLPK